MSQTPPQLTLLIAEDDRMSRDLMRAALKPFNFNIVTAVDGMEAMEMLREHKPRIVLLDILLPRINGLELLQELKEKNQLGEYYVIVVSALGFGEVVRQATMVGARDFIVKPFDIANFQDRIRRALAAVQANTTPPAA